MANGIRTGDPRGFNKGRRSKFQDSSRVRQTPEDVRRTYRPKLYRNNKKDEDNNPKTLNDKNPRITSPVGKILLVYTKNFTNILLITITLLPERGKGLIC